MNFASTSQPLAVPVNVTLKTLLERKNSSSTLTGNARSLESPQLSRTESFSRIKSNISFTSLHQHFDESDHLEDHSRAPCGKTRGMRLELGFLVVQAVLFLMNLASYANPGISIPTFSQFRVFAWKVVTLPRRVFSKGVKWLSTVNKRRKIKLTGLKTRIRGIREGRREVNQAKAKVLKDLGLERDSCLDSKAAVKFFKQAARLDPSDFEAQVFHSKCLSDRGKFSLFLCLYRFLYNLTLWCLSTSASLVKTAIECHRNHFFLFYLAYCLAPCLFIMPSLLVTICNMSLLRLNIFSKYNC